MKVVHDRLYIPEDASLAKMFALSSPLTEASDGRLKCLVGLMVKCSCLEVLGCCSLIST